MSYLQDLKFKTLATRLAEHRQWLAGEEKLLKEAQHRLEQTPLWEEVQVRKKQMAEVKAMVAEHESQLRARVLKLYPQVQEKKTPVGTVRETTIVTTPDDQAAIKWLVGHGLYSGLRLHSSEWQKIAKLHKPDCVTITTELRVALSKDLSDFLPLPFEN